MGAPEQQRRAIQDSKESIAKLSKYYNLNPKILLSVENAHLPKMLIWAQSTQCFNSGRGSVAFRKHTLLPLDDCLYALQSTIPHFYSQPKKGFHKGQKKI